MACAEGGGGGGGGNRDSGPGDGGPPIDAGRDGGPDAQMAECTMDSDCTDDGVFCNGSLSCQVGRCVTVAIPSCDDGVTCTVDACSDTMNMCTHTPDDAMCPMGTRCYAGRGCADAPPCEFDSDCADDGVFCNGVESCVMGACRSAGSRTCDDMNNCTVDECSDAMSMCLATPFPDFLTNVMRCGTGANDCVPCPAPAPALHQTATCDMGACGAVCEMGYLDADGNAANGCEYLCTPTGGVDLPDDAFRDSNCDGIDGDRALAVFLSNIGSDMNDGLTPATPVATVGRALTVAGTSARSQILVVTATYNVSAAVSLTGGISLYGGYSSDFLTRADTRASIVSSAATAVRAQSLTAPVTVDRINMTTADQTATSASTTTLFVRDSGDYLTLRWVNVLAGRGGNGTDGGPGATGTPGTRGDDGSGSSGGNGGAVGGGAGTAGRRQAAGLGGTAGSGGSCGTGGAAGSGSGTGGLGCGDGDPQAGGNGGTGCTAGPGASGSAGDGLGTLAADGTWTANRGGTGATGGRGGGGGGGGAGGGEDCEACAFGACTCVYCDTGRGGGGGGGGGAGGTGGTGGNGGGASIGIVLLNSTLTAHQLRVQTAGGGRGGAGGAGGGGGTGGGGGAGATPSNSSQGRGGNGGNGGNGGSGGCGGGGGGGPSVGIWGTGTSSMFRESTPVVFVIGAGGGGGSSCGSSGTPGTESNTRQAFPG
jgi:hypothetical protein